jgi:post-segregation antitoxin (ccd killing protein)
VQLVADEEGEELREPDWGITMYGQLTALGDNGGTWKPATVQMEAVVRMITKTADFRKIKGTANTCSRWERLVRAWALNLMISDIGRLSITKRKELRETKELPSRSRLTKELLFRAACTLISEAQSTAFEIELKHFKKKAVWPSDSTLAKVAAYVDRMGVIRAQGRTLLQVGTPPLV